MALFSLVVVLFIEQIRPSPYREAVHAPLTRLARFLEKRFNAGERAHGVVAWCVGVGGLVLFAAGIYVALRFLSPALAWLWNVLLLYLALGFRQFSHYYTDIQLALRMNDLPHAREVLAEWRGGAAEDWSASDIARLAIRQALKASHIHVFGVLSCFTLLPGPCGAVLYRAAAFFAENWGLTDAGSRDFGTFSRRAFVCIDWLPARLTAVAFAVVGNFENAVFVWKTYSGKSDDDAGLLREPGVEIVLASGAGALGVCLEASADSSMDNAMAAGSDEVDMGHMQSAVGLVWRALMLWLLLLLLLNLAGL